MSQEQDELLNQRHLDQNVSGADEQEVEQERPHAGLSRQPRAQHQRRQQQISSVASRLTAIRPNSSGTALLTL